MDSGFYAASTALMARTSTLDTIANNLANASTAGFRAERDVFSSVLANAGTSSTSPLDSVINSYGIMSGTMVDVKQGALTKTGNPLDLAIEGQGYFTIQTATGQLYTRNGSFQVSSTGKLTNASGDAVLGDTGLPITLPPGAVTISPDGTISSSGALVGKLKIVEFPAGTELANAGETNYLAPAGVKPTPATNSDVRQGALEASNVNPVASMIQLVEAQRGAEMMQRALGMFNNEMDKTASQDLPKVG